MAKGKKKTAPKKKAKTPSTKRPGVAPLGTREPAEYTSARCWAEGIDELVGLLVDYVEEAATMSGVSAKTRELVRDSLRRKFNKICEALANIPDGKVPASLVSVLELARDAGNGSDPETLEWAIGKAHKEIDQPLYSVVESWKDAVAPILDVAWKAPESSEGKTPAAVELPQTTTRNETPPPKELTDSPLETLRQLRDYAAAVLAVIDARGLEGAQHISQNSPLADNCRSELENTDHYLGQLLFDLPRVPKQPGGFPTLLDFPINSLTSKQRQNAQAGDGLLFDAHMGLFGGVSWKRGRHFGTTTVSPIVCRQLREGIKLLDEIVPKGQSPKSGGQPSANQEIVEFTAAELPFVAKLRTAILALGKNKHGRDAKTDVVLRKAKVNDSEGLGLLRQLAMRGEYNGHMRASRKSRSAGS